MSFKTYGGTETPHHIQGDRLAELVRNLIQGGFFGELLIKFEAGKLVVVKKTESIKL